MSDEKPQPLSAEDERKIRDDASALPNEEDLIARLLATVDRERAARAEAEKDAREWKAISEANATAARGFGERAEAAESRISRALALLQTGTYDATKINEAIAVLRGTGF